LSKSKKTITNSDELSEFINEMIDDDSKHNESMIMALNVVSILFVASAIAWSIFSYNNPKSFINGEIGLLFLTISSSLLLAIFFNVIVNRVSRMVQHLSAISGMVATSGSYLPVLLSGLFGDLKTHMSSTKKLETAARKTENK